MLFNVSKASLSFALRAAALRRQASSSCRRAERGELSCAGPIGAERCRALLSKVGAYMIKRPFGALYTVVGLVFKRLNFCLHQISFSHPGSAKESTVKTNSQAVFHAINPLPLRSTLSVLCQQRGQKKALANHSLNRTHCGVRPKARHFILGF